MTTEKTENAAKTETTTKNEITRKTETATKKRDNGKRRRMSEKDEIISAIFLASEWALQLQDKETREIVDYIYKMMSLTKYSGFFTRPCVKFVVDSAETFIRSVKEKSGVNDNVK